MRPKGSVLVSYDQTSSSSFAVSPTGLEKILTHIFPVYIFSGASPIVSLFNVLLSDKVDVHPFSMLEGCIKESLKNIAILF